MLRAHWPLLAILLVAALLRFYRIAQDDFWYDELQSMESSAGRGWVELDLPRDVMIEHPVKPGTLKDAAPWWEIGAAMRQREVMPPGYFIVLRFWREAFGDSEWAVRALSAVASVIGVVLIYFVAGDLYGRTAAIWSAILMTITPTQIQYAQEARAYALATTFLLGALLAMLRIQRRGPSVARVGAFGGCVFAAVLSHYFAAGPAIALSIYAAIVYRGRVRVTALSTMFVSAILYLALWGPGMLAQHKNFQRDIHGMGVVKPAIMDLAQWFIAAPVSQISIFIPFDEHRWILIVAGVLLLVAIGLCRRGSRYAIGPLWIICGLAVLALIDSTGSSSTLIVPRYSVMAAPGIFLMFSATLAGENKILRHLAPLLLLLLCMAYMRQAYEPYKEKWRSTAELIAEGSQPGDVIVIGSRSHRDWWVGRSYLGVVYYGADANNQFGLPMVLATHPPEGQLLEQLRTHSHLWVITDSSSEGPEFILPGVRIERFKQIHDVFMLFRVSWGNHG